MAAARRALRLLHRAYERWQREHDELFGIRVRDEEHREELASLLHGYAVEFLLWTRGLDDWCCGNEGGSALPSYVERRAGVEGLLDGARYVANHAVHQLVIFSRPTTAFSFPLEFPFGFDKFATIEWLPEMCLPPEPAGTSASRRRLRQQYVDHLANQPIASTMENLRHWFAEQLAT